jgi:hypothetical protein
MLANTGARTKSRNLAKSNTRNELANSGDQPPTDAKRSARLPASQPSAFAARSARSYGEMPRRSSRSERRRAEHRKSAQRAKAGRTSKICAASEGGPNIENPRSERRRAERSPISRFRAPCESALTPPPPGAMPTAVLSRVQRHPPTWHVPCEGGFPCSRSTDALSTSCEASRILRTTTSASRGTSPDGWSGTTTDPRAQPEGIGHGRWSSPWSSPIRTRHSSSSVT